ncbi:hypothetical protein DRN73_09745 [Candidatus Pacearchaeota archaeon]|nr:MAG: hypothetical protein DRN73_09745 [Candidatus Pacearchaeota archaeon]
MFLYFLSFCFIEFSWGLYYIFLKPRFVDLHANYFSILLIDSLSALAGLLSVLWGWLGDKYNRKTLLLLSSLGAFSIFFVGRFNKINILLIFIFFSSLFVFMGYPMIRVGFSFAGVKGLVLLSVAMAIGWSMGSIFSGLFHDVFKFDYKLIYTISAFIFFSGTLIAYFFYPKEAECERSKVSFKKLFEEWLSKSLRGIGLGVFLLQMGITLGYALLTVKLYKDVLGGNKLHFAFVWGAIPSIMAILMSPLYGKIVDKLGGLKSSVLVSGLYFLNLLILIFSKGLLMVLVWFIPLWNFMVIALNRLISDITLKEDRGKGMGYLDTVINSAMFLAGFLGVLVDKFSINFGYFLSVLFVFMSFLTFLSLDLKWGRVLGERKGLVRD